MVVGYVQKTEVSVTADCGNVIQSSKEYGVDKKENYYIKLQEDNLNLKLQRQRQPLLLCMYFCPLTCLLGPL